ncbi:uncharacterized protein B0J16DRAFT_398029 [Fusarium flagelliforme]|uniref:uncharacterized protein n=1 Tax=Fusarium flagelliforme TaxID=2675880 RepID=UPI001E8E5B9D|nr:uncharacterized protein B0J16DRAFT_398029 [Fusarium flagelliforme]KAH7184657.1 hypothetical protein B0J16DRAFT_398029 [Fusarium flagelliforme]
MANRDATPLPESTAEKLSTPFSSDSSVTSAESCLANLPASIVIREQSMRPARNLPLFLQSDLEPWKIDQIYNYLWFARGPILRARSLHRYSITRRQVVITESPSEHLISDYSVIFIKPLPEYLLSYEFWDQHLSGDKALHSAACGFLLSYTWLVAYRTDFNIARECSLLPESLTWNAWTLFTNSFLDHLEDSETQLISQRYLYGELRMSRINYIYKLIPSLWFGDKPTRGFMPTSMWNKSFLERNIARLLGLFVFLSLILSAMQVGLSTSQLQENVNFVNASYGFVVASLFVVLLTAAVSLVVLIWNIRYKILLPWTLGLKEMRGHDF